MVIVYFMSKQQSFFFFSHNLTECNRWQLSDVAPRHEINTDMQFINYTNSYYFDISTMPWFLPLVQFETFPYINTQPHIILSDVKWNQSPLK
jgi:hypothetical protein